MQNIERFFGTKNVYLNCFYYTTIIGFAKATPETRFWTTRVHICYNELTAEVGMAYSLNKPMIGLDYNADKDDIMCYYAFDEVIPPAEMEKTLSKYK